MIKADVALVESSPRPFRTEAADPSGLGRPVREDAGISLLWRIVLLFVGFNIAVLGWTLVMSVFLSFIGLPLFILGASLMQSQAHR